VSRHSARRRLGPNLTEDEIAALRRQRLTGKNIAGQTCVSPATVSRVLKEGRTATNDVGVEFRRRN
jgi:CRP-like cAMP-binding protein